MLDSKYSRLENSLPQILGLVVRKSVLKVSSGNLAVVTDEAFYLGCFESAANMLGPLSSNAESKHNNIR